MLIAIIGAGQVGKALGAGWGKAGHSVRYGVRDPKNPKYASLGAQWLSTPAEAAKLSEVVVLATPWNATLETVKSLGNLGGKVVLDCTNPLEVGTDGLGLAFGFSTSAGEKVAEAAPGASVFKTLNTTGAENMTNAKAFSPAPAMFAAGDDATKKPIVLGLLHDLGFEGIDAGPLRNARLLEANAMLWIDLCMKRGQGRNFAFALARRS